MAKQVIISIGREYGSGGHEIARHLAEKFDLPIYDHNLLDEIAAGKHVDSEVLAKYDELPSTFMKRTVRGFSNSPEENIAQLQFDFLKTKAKSGESFVIVGRCSEVILKENPGLIPIFIMGDYETKLERVMERRGLSAKDAAIAIHRHDKKRKAYHNHYSEMKWGDSRNYDICINSSRLGIDGTVNALYNYIEERMKLL